MKTPTKEQVAGAVEILKALADVIKELGEIPAGHLYATAMSSMTLDSFENAIGVLVKAGLVARDRSHLLRWVGP